MKSSLHTKSIVAGLAVGGLWVAARAAGSVADPATVPPTAAHAQSTGDDQSSAIVLRRDASHTAPVVADLSTQPGTSADDDGFNWGLAAIGAGGVLLAAALLMGGSSALSRRRTSKPRGAVSQGA